MVCLYTVLSYTTLRDTTSRHAAMISPAGLYTLNTQLSFISVLRVRLGLERLLARSIHDRFYLRKAFT